MLVSVSLILLVGLPCWTSFLLVSLQDKLMPRKRESFSCRKCRVFSSESCLELWGWEASVGFFELVLQLQKKYAKLGKDILKNFGWLDLGRKVYPREDGLHTWLPIIEKFSVMFLIKQGHDGGAFEEGW